MQKSNLIMLVGLASFLLIGPSSAICYGKYGCFTKAPPFNNLVVGLPQPPSKVRTHYLLHTRTNKYHPQSIDDSSQSKLQNSDFDISRTTIIIVHGWRERASTKWVPRMKAALLDRVDCNVILVDWSGGSENLWYYQAAGNTRLVGRQIAELIKFLIFSNRGFSQWAKRFYVIGFSLGGQVAGYVGRRLRFNGMTLGRITGLDPANPSFTNTHPAVRLDRTDAAFVDVIHTNARFAGTVQSVGHIDFWPNNGSFQPGCFDITEIFKKSCHHLRATEYYTASVQNRCSWRAYPCSKCRRCNGDCPWLGYYADRTQKRGNYYLKTNSKAPFCGLY